MHRNKWSTIKRQRLEKWHVHLDYLSDPILWYDGMKFEIQQYGTTQRNRMYLMRRWHKRIDALPDDCDPPKLLLYIHLSKVLSDKLRHIRVWESHQTKKKLLEMGFDTGSEWQKDGVGSVRYKYKTEEQKLSEQNEADEKAWEEYVRNRDRNL